MVRIPYGFFQEIRKTPTDPTGFIPRKELRLLQHVMEKAPQGDPEAICEANQSADGRDHPGGSTDVSGEWPYGRCRHVYLYIYIIHGSYGFLNMIFPLAICYLPCSSSKNQWLEDIHFFLEPGLFFFQGRTCYLLIGFLVWLSCVFRPPWKQRDETWKCLLFLEKDGWYSNGFLLIGGKCSVGGKLSDKMTNDTVSSYDEARFQQIYYIIYVHMIVYVYMGYLQNLRSW